MAEDHHTAGTDRHSDINNKDIIKYDIYIVP